MPGDPPLYRGAGSNTDLAVLGPFFPYDSIFVSVKVCKCHNRNRKNHKDTCSDARDNPVESDIFTGFHKMFLMLVFPVYRCEVLDGFYLRIGCVEGRASLFLLFSIRKKFSKIPKTQNIILLHRLLCTQKNSTTNLIFKIGIKTP